MATNQEESSRSPENFTVVHECPHCGNIFDDVLLTTEHKLRLTGPKDSRASHEDLDYVELVCPHCKGITKFSVNRVKERPMGDLADDFERDLMRKVDALTQRCKIKEWELEMNIQSIDLHRRDICTAIQNLEEDVKDAYNKKAGQLEENERILQEEIQSLQKRFDEDLDELEAKDRQKIKSISSIAIARLGHLQTDSLTAHTLLCEELDDLLKEATDDKTSAANISEDARHKRFVPSDDALLALGKISTTSVRSVKEVDLPCYTFGIAKKSEDSVAVALHDCRRVDIIDRAGKREPLAGIPSLCYVDIAIQFDSDIFLSHNSPTEIHRHRHTTEGCYLFTTHINPSDYHPRLNIGPSKDLVVANGKDEIYIYDSSGETLTQTVPTRCNPSRQAFLTRSGVIVSSSCDMKPSVLTVYDRDGRAGSSLTANQDENLYAAADDQDRIYVAAVNTGTGEVSITLYELDQPTLKLKEKCRFEKMKMDIKDSWCYLVTLSRSMLCLACYEKLYFIEVCT